MVDEGVRAVQATYELDDGGALFLRLGAVDEVLARDGRLIPAYRLEVQQSLDGDVHTRLAYYLDASFDVIRFDNECAELVAGECARQRAYWYVNGFPPGFGVGLPVFAPASGPLEVRLDQLDADIDVQRTENRGEVHYAIGIDDDDLIGPGTLLPGDYVFHGDRVVPDSFRAERRSAVLEGTLVDYNPGELLPEMPDYDAIVPPRGTPPDLLFPGSDSVFLDRTDSARGLLERARAEVSEFEQAWSQGCLAGFEIREGSASAESISPIGEDVVERFTAWTVGHGRSTEWTFEIRRERLDGNENVVAADTENSTYRFGCDELAGMPPPCGSAADWLAAIDRAASDDFENERVKVYDRDDAQRGNGSMGVMRYSYYAQPPWVSADGAIVSYQTLQVQVDASTGWLYHIDLDRESADTLLSSEWTLCH